MAAETSPGLAGKAGRGSANQRSPGLHRCFPRLQEFWDTGRIPAPAGQRPVGDQIYTHARVHAHSTEAGALLLSAVFSRPSARAGARAQTRRGSSRLLESGN